MPNSGCWFLKISEWYQKNSYVCTLWTYLNVSSDRDFLLGSLPLLLKGRSGLQMRQLLYPFVLKNSVIRLTGGQFDWIHSSTYSICSYICVLRKLEGTIIFCSVFISWRKIFNFETVHQNVLWHSKCGNLPILLPLIFYVKSNWAILVSQ